MVNNAVLIDEVNLRKLYLDNKLPMYKIADIYGVSVTTVFNYCKKYGIKTRENKEVFNFTGRKHTKEVCDNISKVHKGKILSQETKNKISRAHEKGGIGHKKKHNDGYVKIYFPDHPKCSKDGYIMEHILVMECMLGRWLHDDECVHHINEKKDDNRICNLKLMTKTEHMSYHSKKRWEEKKNVK